jgi:hypothetical protein
MIIQRGIIVAIKVIDVPGIGPKTAEYLISEGLETAEDLLNAGIGQLIQAPGFHLNRANTVLEAARALIASGGVTVSAKKTAPKSVKKAAKKKEAKKAKKEKSKDKKSKKDKEDKKSKKNKKGKGKAKGKDKKKGKKKKKS